jgi:hypothetical protein
MALGLEAGMTTKYWITGTSCDWSQAADWLSGAVPGSTDDVMINSSNAVTVNGTSVAHSFVLDNSTLTVGGTLTLGTSLDISDFSQLILSGGTLSAQSITSTHPIGGVELIGYGRVNAEPRE